MGDGDNLRCTKNTTHDNGVFGLPSEPVVEWYDTLAVTRQTRAQRGETIDRPAG